jgi:hypothetical protein
VVAVAAAAIENWQFFIAVLFISADRLEDLTPPELIRQNPKVDRTVSLYGL